MGTAPDNKKPAFLTKRRATRSHPDLRRSGLGNSAEKVFEMYPTEFLASGNTGNKICQDQIPSCYFAHSSYAGEIFLVGTQKDPAILSTALTIKQ